MQPYQSPLPDTSLVQGVRSGLHGFIGSLIGLALGIWSVPGVPAVIDSWLSTNLLPLALSIGLSTGFVGLVMGWFNPNMKNI